MPLLLGAKRRRIYDFTRRIVSKWATGSAARAFERWRAVTGVKRAAMSKARGFVMRARNRVAGAAFTAWATYTLALLAAKDNAVLFAVRMMRFSAHKALRRWREVGLSFYYNFLLLPDVAWKQMNPNCETDVCAS